MPKIIRNRVSGIQFHIYMINIYIFKALVDNKLSQKILAASSCCQEKKVLLSRNTHMYKLVIIHAQTLNI